MPKKNPKKPKPNKDWVENDQGQWIRRDAISMDWVRDDRMEVAGGHTYTVMLQITGCGGASTCYRTYEDEQEAHDVAEELRSK